MTTAPTRPYGAKPGRSPANRSLERGVEILRAFRPGSDVLGNGDIAERTGLSRSTVTRLTQTLVGSGLLQLDTARRAYRLAPAVLSLAQAMRAGSGVLATAAPLMRSLAERLRINVGLAAPDGDDMVYLESIRYNRRVAFRNVVSGQRVPMELTSLGRAHLATLQIRERKELLAQIRRRRGSHWPAVAAAIDQAVEDVQAQGWCGAAWQAEVVALATPLTTSEGPFSLNVSVTTIEPIEAVARQLADPLLALRQDILRGLSG
jgi:DNA-binding IclR family transcriptional regulator